VDTQYRLLILGLNWNEPDIGPGNGLAYRFGVIVVIFASFAVWFDKLGRNEADAVPELTELPSPVVRTRAGFHAN